MLAGVVVINVDQEPVNGSYYPCGPDLGYASTEGNFSNLVWYKCGIQQGYYRAKSGSLKNRVRYIFLVFMLILPLVSSASTINVLEKSLSLRGIDDIVEEVTIGGTLLEHYE